jgi:hypothetical protein
VKSNKPKDRKAKERERTNGTGTWSEHKHGNMMDEGKALELETIRYPLRTRRFLHRVELLFLFAFCVLIVVSLAVTSMSSNLRELCNMRGRMSVRRNYM